ncbi:hypothetical protein UFOVP116_175 [uncultured Caudovirales phage]|uniref:Uncharacterized protein n=1 Tax=uncultured Caudovirales phage TaxID=2100421 RepID=A0A6J5L6A1_9CAUD|nr:hypothetical protein UFOVP116_175 [uncultured Caudovirales phage]
MDPKQEFHEFVLEGHAEYIESLGVQVHQLQRELYRALDRIASQGTKISELEQRLNHNLKFKTI